LESINTWYTLQRYHITGSRILSRSFHVERWNSGEIGLGSGDEHEHVPEDSTENPQANTSIESAMDVDCAEGGDKGFDEESNDTDSDEGDEFDIAMVPMADLLNARYDSDNVSHEGMNFSVTNFLVFALACCSYNSSQAKLFYEEHHLHMVTTKPIKAGEQIVSRSIVSCPFTS